MFCKTIIFGQITKIGHLETRDGQPAVTFTLVTPCSLAFGSNTSLHQHEVMAFRKAATFVKNCCRVDDMVTVDGENYLHDEGNSKKYMVYARHVNLMKVRPVAQRVHGNDMKPPPVINGNRAHNGSPKVLYKKKY
jgi:hypothetical protein